MGVKGFVEGVNNNEKRKYSELRGRIYENRSSKRIVATMAG